MAKCLQRKAFRNNSRQFYTSESCQLRFCKLLQDAGVDPRTVSRGNLKATIRQLNSKLKAARKSELSSVIKFYESKISEFESDITTIKKGEQDSRLIQFVNEVRKDDSSKFYTAPSTGSPFPSPSPSPITVPSAAAGRAADGSLAAPPKNLIGPWRSDGIDWLPRGWTWAEAAPSATPTMAADTKAASSAQGTAAAAASQTPNGTTPAAQPTPSDTKAPESSQASASATAPMQVDGESNGAVNGVASAVSSSANAGSGGTASLKRFYRSPAGSIFDTRDAVIAAAASSNAGGDAKPRPAASQPSSTLTVTIPKSLPAGAGAGSPSTVVRTGPVTSPVEVPASDEVKQDTSALPASRKRSGAPSSPAAQPAPKRKRVNAARMASAVRRKATKGTERYRGVYQTKSNKWQAKISIRGTLEHLGTFSTALEAARVWDTRARELGKSPINFPDESPGVPPSNGEVNATAYGVESDPYGESGAVAGEDEDESKDSAEKDGEDAIAKRLSELMAQIVASEPAQRFLEVEASSSGGAEDTPLNYTQVQQSVDDGTLKTLDEVLAAHADIISRALANNGKSSQAYKGATKANRFFTEKVQELFPSEAAASLATHAANLKRLASAKPKGKTRARTPTPKARERARTLAARATRKGAESDSKSGGEVNSSSTRKKRSTRSRSKRKR